MKNQLGLYELAIENAELHDIVDRLNSNLEVELMNSDEWILDNVTIPNVGEQFFQHEIGLFGSEEFEARLIGGGL